MKVWDYNRVIGFDMETSGKMKEFALQPWRIPAGDAWPTSISVVQVLGQPRRPQVMPTMSGLFPDKAKCKAFLEHARDAKLRIVGWNTVFDIMVLIGMGLKELVFQCQWLDGMLIWKHATVEPEYGITTSGKRKLYGLKACVAELYPQYANYAEDVDFHSTDPAELQKLQTYNDRDVAFTLGCAKHWWDQLNDRQRRVAIIEAASLPHVALANYTGMLIDPLTIHELQVGLDRTAHDKLTLLLPLGVTEATVRSPIKLATMLFDTWGLTPIKFNRSKLTNKVTRSTDKETLYEIAHTDPRAKTLRDYREALNLKTKFADAPLASAEYHGDGYARPAAIIFGTYCVPGDTEVLTREGWCRIDQWSGGEIVQAREGGSLEFLPATLHRDRADQWVDVPALGGLFTRNHTMVHLSARDKWVVQQADDWVRAPGYQRNVPVVGRIEGLTGRWTATQMRLFAAVQADGSYISRHYKGRTYRPYLKFTLKKPRKIARLRDLLTDLGITFRDYTPPAYPDRVEITVGTRSLPDWLGEDKKVFGPWVLDTTATGLLAFVNEVRSWDGSQHQDGDATKYVSFVRSNLDWVQAAAALVGRKSNVHTCDRVLHISRGGTRTVRPHGATLIETQPMDAYCPVTETGFWLARRNGRTFITGNSGRMTYSANQMVERPNAKGTGMKQAKAPVGFALHQMKNGPQFRTAVVAPPGCDIVEFDAAGQEFRWMAEASGDETMRTLCLPGEDPHSFMGARIAHRDYKGLILDLKHKDEKISKLANDQRKLGKVGNLCVSAGTMILTDRGPCSIENVCADDRVWDGVEFVHHAGVVCSGVKRVISYQGLTATPRHEVLVDGFWQTLHDTARHAWRIEPAMGASRARVARSTARIVAGLVSRAVSEKWRAVRAGALRLRDRVRREPAVHGNWPLDAVQGVCGAAAAPSRRSFGDHHTCGPSPAETHQRMVSAMHQSEGSLVAQLRGSRDRVSLRVRRGGAELRQGGAATSDVSEAGHRSQGQRRSLRAWKLALGLTQGEPCQSGTTKVYDIVGAGPRGRFAANGVIVHNSLQYRTSAPKLRSVARVQYNIPMELPEAERIRSTYLHSYEMVPIYWDQQIAKTKRLGYVETLAGRRVKVVGDWSGNWGWSMGSTAINYRIQGTGADQKYLAVACLEETMRDHDAVFAWDLHDGLYFYVPSDKSMAFAAAGKKVLDALPYKQAWGITPSIPMPFDVKVGGSWGTLKELKL